MKQLLKIISSKIFVVPFLILLQLFLILYPVHILQEYNLYFKTLNHIMAVILAIYIASRKDNPMYRLTWILLILVSPILGICMYLLFGAKKVPKELYMRDKKLQEGIHNYLSNKEHISLELEDVALKQSKYLSSVGFPIYKHTISKYFDVGEKQFEEMLIQIKSAQKFIFMEFFIIKDGYMWNKILEILKEKAKEGIDVRILYDDFGCFTFFEKNYLQYLKNNGIKVKAFNPIKPRLAIQMNNRDHRKILVVDGKIAMTGGINIGDEYINRESRFGHWKDCGCMLMGEAVWSFTFMFLQFWNYDEKIKDDYNLFHYKYESSFKNDGYVQPFNDAPTDEENVGENVHLNMINNASKYVYIMTPYLVIDHEMKTALTLAVKNGVDVRIVVPHIPDKWYVFSLTRYFYSELVKAGVKVYEYTPGFVHAKTFISDDKYAVVGTTNMDYRSYYLHYECGAFFYKSSLISDMKEDYLNTVNSSEEISIEKVSNVKIIVRIIRIVLNLLSPLM